MKGILNFQIPGSVSCEDHPSLVVSASLAAPWHPSVFEPLSLNVISE